MTGCFRTHRFILWFLSKLNVSSNTVAKIECGLRRPSVDFVVNLVNFLDTIVDYIILGEEIKKERNYDY